MIKRGMLFGFLALASLSCTGTVPPGGYGVSAIQFSDVVVPDGMNLRDDDEESFSVEVGSWRSGHLVYGGTAQVDAVSGWVLQRMPLHAWELTDDQTPDDRSRHLRFQRGPYVAEYSIQRRENRTTMIVDYRTEPPSR